jgi:hypothetical protein
MMDSNKCGESKVRSKKGTENFIGGIIIALMAFLVFTLQISNLCSLFTGKSAYEGSVFGMIMINLIIILILIILFRWGIKQFRKATAKGFGKEINLDCLLDKIHNGNLKSRQNASSLLFLVEDTRGVEVSLAALQDEDKIVRLNAIRSLISTSEGCTRLMNIFLSDKSDDVKTVEDIYHDISIFKMDKTLLLDKIFRLSVKEIIENIIYDIKGLGGEISPTDETTKRLIKEKLDDFLLSCVAKSRKIETNLPILKAWQSLNDSFSLRIHYGKTKSSEINIPKMPKRCCVCGSVNNITPQTLRYDHVETFSGGRKEYRRYWKLVVPVCSNCLGKTWMDIFGTRPNPNLRGDLISMILECENSDFAGRMLMMNDWVGLVKRE